MEQSILQREKDADAERVRLKHMESRYREDYEQQILKLQEVCILYSYLLQNAPPVNCPVILCCNFKLPSFFAII